MRSPCPVLKNPLMHYQGPPGSPSWTWLLGTIKYLSQRGTRQRRHSVPLLGCSSGTGCLLVCATPQALSKEVNYLGHIISREGVATDRGKIEAVAGWPRPNHVSELRSFLGFASYYRRFVQGFAKLAAPLHRLVAQLTGTNAGNHQVEAFMLHGQKSVSRALRG